MYLGYLHVSLCLSLSSSSSDIVLPLGCLRKRNVALVWVVTLKDKNKENIYKIEKTKKKSKKKYDLKI